MKRWSILSLAFLLVLASSVAACTPTQGSAGADGLMAPAVTIRHETVPPVNSRAVPQTSVSVPNELAFPAFAAFSDGGSIVAGSLAKVKTENGIQKTVSSKLRVLRYDGRGKTLWSREYAELSDGIVGAVKALPDGGFVLQYGETVGSAGGLPGQCLVFCGPDGAVRKQYRWVEAAVPEFLCVTGDGDVFVVGEGVFEDGKLVSGSSSGIASDVAILRFSADGTLRFCRKFGGSDYDSPTCEVYSPADGLVVAMRVQSKDGDIHAPDGLKGVPCLYLLVSFDEGGKERWQYCVPDAKAWLTGPMTVTQSGVAATVGNESRYTVLQLGHDGRKLWETPLADGESLAVEALTTLKDGRIAAAVQPLPQNGEETPGSIVLLDRNGTMLRETAPLSGYAATLTPTDDGGLTVLALQNVKVLPMPLYLSSIWYDTETIATKLDDLLHVQWRQTYDRHPDARWPDVVMALSDGRLIVEKE